MRCIKFRGKRYDNNEWVFGNFIKRRTGTGFKYFINNGLFDFQVDLSTVGQYTGFCDQNGREIYEGDIVRDSDDIHEDGEVFNIYGEIAFIDGCFKYVDIGRVFRTGNTKTAWSESLCECHLEVEVVGNVQEKLKEPNYAQQC